MRELIKDRFKAELEKQDYVLAFFEGGSASFGRADEYSDLDFGIVVKDEAEELAVKLIYQIMQGIAPIETSFIMPQPAWHGFWQGFFHLQGSSPYLLLDICIIKQSAKSYLTEEVMHGKAVVFFDHTGRVGKEKTDMAEIERVIPGRISRARFINGMLHNFVDKEVSRNRLVDAIDLYYGMLLRTLVELLRIKHDRVRFSFGCRYLSYDLPPEIYDRLQGLFLISDAADLLRKKEIVHIWTEELLAEYPA